MRVAGFGAGGHATVIIDALRLNAVDVACLTDSSPVLLGSKVNGVLVRGDDSIWPQLLDEGIRAAFIGIGSTGDSKRRRHLYERARDAGFAIISVIHPSATISSTCSLGVGVIVMSGAIVNSGALIGDNVIINTAAVVEHDCVIGSHAHVATGARLAGGVRVGEGAHVGIGASVRELISIGADAVVGAGSAVVKNVPPGVTVVGVPARSIERNVKR